MAQNETKEEMLLRLAQTIREARINRGYTQAELAEMTGMSRVNLTGIESGTRRVGTDVLFRLATALRLKVELVDDLEGPASEI